MLAVGTLEPGRTSTASSRRPAWRASSYGSSGARLGRRRGPGWLGRVSDDELARLYRGATCVAYASLYEGFVRILEAMACGAPVVTSRGGATEETAGGAAVLVDPLDPSSHHCGARGGRGAARRATRDRHREGEPRFRERGSTSGPSPSTGKRRDSERRSSLSMPTSSAASGPATRRTSRTCSGHFPEARRRRVAPRRGHPASRARAQRGRSASTSPPARRSSGWPGPFRAYFGRVRPALAHFQHVIPPRCPSPAVVTVHDLSFERDVWSMQVRSTGSSFA